MLGPLTSAPAAGRADMPEPAGAQGAVWCWAEALVPKIDETGTITGVRRVVFLPAIVSRDEDGLFVANCPCLRGCIVQARTKKAALAALQETAEDFKAICDGEGRSLPLLVREADAGAEPAGFVVLEV